MSRQTLLSGFLLALLCCAATGQVLTIPGSTNLGSAFAVDAIQSAQMDFNFLTINSQNPSTTPLQTPSGSVSKLEWDAVNFAAEKLASRSESQPVARVMVVISDGEDNSSSVTLKEAIASALRREVVVYTVSTRDLLNEEENAVLGDRALQTISELTGGAAYRPGSVSRLNGSLSELQEVIRSRYLISYRPASFHRDGRYRPVDIIAEKNGHKLRVYARRGYYASAAQRQVPDVSQ